jgi:tetratricopeptide (TPR) repeat protein
MLREIADALSALTAHTPLVLVLEDLHWSDGSTLDLISYVARRRRTPHLMVVGTYRPAELIVSGHPLKTMKQELLARRQCEELPLEYLTREAVGEHLDARFPVNLFPPDLAGLLHDRTEGNPLFMVNTVDHLIAERLIEPRDGVWQVTAPVDTVKVGVPESIRQLIEALVDRLDAVDQRILEAASVAGAEFSALAVSAALERDLHDVEVRCEGLSRRHQFIGGRGTELLPDGQTVDRFGFVHAVYRHVLYERISRLRRADLHRRIGRRGEELYGERTAEIAAEMAMHFEQAADHERAALYLQQAAANAMRRSAYREAIALARRGLELLATLPDTDERARRELWMQITLGVPLIATEGYAAPDVGSVYVKARELCERLHTTPEISQVLWGLWTFHVLKGELSTALAVANEFLRLAERVPYPGLAMRGHWALEITSTHQGEFGLALEHFVKGLSHFDRDKNRDDTFVDVLNPGVAMRCFAGWSSWFIGRPDRGQALLQEAVTLARKLSEPHGLAHALMFAAVLHQLRREQPRVREYAEEAGALAADHGLVLYGAMAQVLGGWALTGEGDDDAAAGQIRGGLAAWQSTGAQLMRPHLLALLSQASPRRRRDTLGLRLLDEALSLTESTGERWYEAELHRLKGEHLLAGARDTVGIQSARACFEQSLAVARRQHALSLELRAAMSLARLHRQVGPAQARTRAGDLVMRVYERFEEGFDTLDLRDARDLLQTR